ncbi:Hypothetical protein CAP_4682 [Chondromyces apiculatus DSM 436]|uniref:Uncharacterized protein n=1 Tax=Chondromyces apiculatus DSM 436 TaxID=1192034 RepID=A0A017T5Y7_9BACT|nr:Hypothetical protein CAP_4682 [Chondromyces apiculatus DSM 436]
MSEWEASEIIPEPLKESAGSLLSRLGTADRLAAASFTGKPADVALVDTMRTAMRRLDAAYVVYRQRSSGPQSERVAAARVLGAEIEEVKAAAMGAV